MLSKDASSQLAPEALYGLGLCELELRRPEPAIKAFRDLLTSWPEHSTAASATFYLAQTLAEQKRYAEAVPLLTPFATKYPKSKLVPDAQYLLGSTRLTMGERDAGAELRFIAAIRAIRSGNRPTPTETIAKAARPQARTRR
jgi:TolA-binding protein